MGNIYKENIPIKGSDYNNLIHQGIEPYWYILDGYCSFLLKINGNPLNEHDRVAFIEKSARIYNSKIETWESIFRGEGGNLQEEGKTIYGFYEPSREAILNYFKNLIK